MERLRIDEKSILAHKLVCSYFDYGAPFTNSLGLVQFECHISTTFFYERCSPRIDEFILSCKDEWDADDESDPLMIELRNAGFLLTREMLESSPLIIFKIVMKYMKSEMAAELFPSEGATADFLVYEIDKIDLVGDMVVVMGEAHKLRQS